MFFGERVCLEDVEVVVVNSENVVLLEEDECNKVYILFLVNS